MNLTAVPAPNAKAAAEYYPARYWLSLLRVPPKSDFPGTGPNGNGIATTVRSQGEWIRNIVNTDGCTGCHQMGNKATREIPKALGTFDNSAAAWERRVQSGQAGAGMLARFNQIGKARALAMWGDWTDRIAGGALPASAPPRPQGRERNVVVTMWDWADPKAYLHDEIASDKRNPTVNANGPVYGAMEESRRLHAGGASRRRTPPTRCRCRCAIRRRSGPGRPRSRRPTGARSRSGRRSPPRTASPWTASSRVWVAARIRPEPDV